MMLGAEEVFPVGVGNDTCCVTFDTDKNKQKALLVLNGYKWRKHVLTAGVSIT